MTISACPQPGAPPAAPPAAPPLAPMSPGTYLRKRREAAGLELEDLAIMLDSDPAVSAHSRAELLSVVERDAAPVTEDLMRAVLRLGDALPIDALVWVRLIDLADGDEIAWPRLCQSCACSEFDPCVHQVEGQQVACHWVAEGLCSACEIAQAAMSYAPPLPAGATVFNGHHTRVDLDPGNGFTAVRQSGSASA